MRIISLIFLLLLISNTSRADYYSSISPYSNNFRADLKNLVKKDHVTLSYKRARKFLFGKLELIKQNGNYFLKDVYCEKLYSNSDMPSRKIGVDMIPDNTVLNCEHTWPKSRFGKASNYKRAPESKQKVSDLHHLFVSDSRMNSIRGNLEFAEVTVPKKELNCSQNKYGYASKLDGTLSNKLFYEPPKDHKGNIARALFYFSVRYNMHISEREEETLRRWNSEDPVDQNEINRNEEIFKVQKNRNPFIDHPEYSDLITDF